MDSISILCIVAFISSIFAAGFTVWCLFKVVEHWNQLFFIKRRRLLTSSLLIQYGAFFLGVPVIITYILLLSTNPNSKTTKTLQKAQFFAYTFLVTPSFIIIQYIYSVRVWLLYYDMLLSKIQKNRQWRMIIDPKTSNIIDSQSKFALKNQNILYKTKPLLKICGIAFIIEYVIVYYPIMIILNVASNGPVLVFTGWGGYFVMPYITTMFFLRFCFGFYIWQKMNRLKMIDNFGIRKEIGYVWIHVSFGIVIFLFSILLNNIVTGLFELIDDQLNDAIVRLTSCYFGLIVGCANVYVTFVYPIRVYNKNFNDKNNTGGDVAENVNYIESIQHWTQIMQTEVGYEEFMDYLASEFSTENLLFITEYIEVKKVLMDHFPHILDKLKNEHTRECGFFVEFATLGSDEYENLEARANGGIKTFSSGLGSLFSGSNGHDDAVLSKENVDSALAPEMQLIQSFIARKLADHLLKLTTTPINASYEKNDNGIVNGNYSYSKQNTIAVGDCIIRAFSCIYSKYVDDYGASFMINISHRNRQSLLKLFDYKYYEKWQKNSNASNADESVIQQVARERNQSIFVKLRNIASNEQELNENNNDKDVKMAVANYLLRNEIANDASCNTKAEFDTRIEWLLKVLIKDMEKAVKEVSNLMQDSFFRFRREKKHLFQYMIKSSSITPNA